MSGARGHTKNLTTNFCAVWYVYIIREKEVEKLHCRKIEKRPKQWRNSTVENFGKVRNWQSSGEIPLPVVEKFHCKKNKGEENGRTVGKKNKALCYAYTRRTRKRNIGSVENCVEMGNWWIDIGIKKPTQDSRVLQEPQH